MRSSLRRQQADPRKALQKGDGAGAIKVGGDPHPYLVYCGDGGELRPALLAVERRGEGIRKRFVSQRVKCWLHPTFLGEGPMKSRSAAAAGVLVGTLIALSAAVVADTV